MNENTCIKSTNKETYTYKYNGYTAIITRVNEGYTSLANNGRWNKNNKSNINRKKRKGRHVFFFNLRIGKKKKNYYKDVYIPLRGEENTEEIRWKKLDQTIGFLLYLRFKWGQNIIPLAAQYRETLSKETWNDIIKIAACGIIVHTMLGKNPMNETLKDELDDTEIVVQRLV